VTEPSERDDEVVATRPVVIRRSDGAVLLGCTSGVMLWLGLTDGMLRYLRSSMRPWLVLAGAVLGLLAVGSAFLAWRDQRRRGGDDKPSPGQGEDDHGAGHVHRPAAVGWLLVLPLLVGVGIAPGALGAYAIRQQSTLALPRGEDFDLAGHLRTHSFGGQVPALELHQFLAAAEGDADQQELLASTVVRLTGFVVNDRDKDHPLELARLMIGCCAGDAIGLVVALDDYRGPPLEDETWIEVTGTFDPDAADARSENPVVRVESFREVSAPDEPYEYPS
jgi:uncharacterized repeat protein (TIGR03943 family)